MSSKKKTVHSSHLLTDCCVTKQFLLHSIFLCKIEVKMIWCKLNAHQMLGCMKSSSLNKALLQSLLFSVVFLFFLQLDNQVNLWLIKWLISLALCNLQHFSCSTICHIKFYLCIYKIELGTWHYGFSLPVWLLISVDQGDELSIAFVILLDIVKVWMDNYQK